MKFLIFVLLAASISAAPGKYHCLRNILGLGDVVKGEQIGARGDYDVKTLLAFQNDEKVKACNLSLKPAQQRCEAVYGEGRCEQISNSAFQTKCDKYFHRTGCCHCTMKCPEGWKEENYHCIKPQMEEAKTFETKEECSKASGTKKCENRGGKWIAPCGHNFKRFAGNCVAICPLGWHDEGPRCRKPANYRMAQPFFWQQGDN